MDKQKGQTSIMVLAGILVLIAVASGVFYLGRSTTPKSSPTPGTTSQITPTPSASPVPNGAGDNPVPNGTGETVYTETSRSANWKTLKNKNGYTINYPSTLKVFPEQYQDVENPEIADGIAIGQATEGYNKPLLKIYVFDSKSTKYKFTSVEELIKLNYEDNISNKDTFIKIIKQPSKSSFNDQEAYEYKIESRGFFGAWTGFLGDQGIIRVIGFMHNNRYFLIGYYDNETFNQILSTFRFD